MTEPTPSYETERPARGADVAALPARAVNLARRVLELERQCAGRGRIAFEVVFLDSEWLLFVSKPGPLERLGE